jgi:DNA-binding CsgD family transcriptional regulator
MTATSRERSCSRCVSLGTVAGEGDAAEGSAEDALSPREREVLDYLSRGYLYKEIAAELALSYDTVHTYVRRIYEKCRCTRRSEAVAKHLTRAGQPLDRPPRSAARGVVLGSRGAKYLGNE